MWALICATAPFVCAQEYVSDDVTDCDTIQYSLPDRLLDEISVTVDRTISKTDRKVIRPGKEALRVSSNGIDLLRRLQLPGVTVNPMTETVSVAGGGDVVLCIDGVEATVAQISAIRPQDVERIEYHDNPGVRYAGVDAVIDFIITRHENGGNISLDSFGAFASERYATIDHFACRLNSDRSVWSANVGFMGQQKDRWIRDYEEVWHYPSEDVYRCEDGLPVKAGMAGMESSVNYNYMHPRGNLLNLRIGFDLNDVPDMEEGDRHAMLTTSDGTAPVEVVEHTEEHSIRPNFSARYLHRFSDTRNLTVDAQFSYLRSRMLHEYSEDGNSTDSRVSGGKYSMNFLGMYEHRVGKGAWSVGVSNNSSFIRNTYQGDVPAEVAVNRSQSAVMGEYSGRIGDWGVMLNLRVVYDCVGQLDRKIDKLYGAPGVTVAYRPDGKWSLRYAASLDYAMPSASEISRVTQSVQTGMVRRGNPDLKPFRVADQSFTASFEHSVISAEARVLYRSEHNPIMESVLYDNGEFVRTYFNQRSFRKLGFGASVAIRPWKDHLSIAAEPMLTRYISHGIDYTHCHNIFRVGVSVDFSYGNWLAYGNIISGPANKMYGEEIIEEKDMNQILAGYKSGKWSLHLGVFNAFMKDYWMETRNLSALTPYKSKAHSGRSCSYLAVKFNLALDFGRKGRDITSPHYDADTDTGILTGTK